jgi:glycosyltransferase involved in cell wall biosynthesis
MVDILGPVNSLSYGNVTKEIVSGLVDLGEKVKLIPINGRIDCEINENLTKALNEKQSDTCIKIWHANDMSMPDYKTKIGWPIFELDTFTEQEKQQLKTLDKIIVCSQWAKQVVIDNGINVETEVVNLGVDDTVFFPSNNNVGEKVVFLNVGKWEVRKGHNELLWAFQDAFKDVGDVELWMACSNPFVDNSQWHNKYKRALGNKVKFVPYLYTQQELAKTINLCSIGVYPSHAEGFGLPILETLACGKPVITTNCTAQTEYCNHENCYLVESTGKVKAQDRE